MDESEKKIRELRDKIVRNIIIKCIGCAERKEARSERRRESS